MAAAPGGGGGGNNAPPLPTLNARAGLPAAPGQRGAANNATREQTVRAQRFVANAATAGVGPPIVIDDAKATAMHWPCCIDNMEVINGINFDSTAMLRDAIMARGHAAAADGVASSGRMPLIANRLESAYKRHRLAIEIDDAVSITHSKRIVRALEAQELREMDGGGN